MLVHKCRADGQGHALGVQEGSIVLRVAGRAVHTLEEFEEGVASMDVASRLTQALAIEEGQQELRGLFEALDKDADGTVSGKEWGAAVSKNVELMAKYFGGLTVPQVAKAFARLDKDGSRDLTWTEFQQGSKRIVTFAPPQA